ncbi:bifunctional nicotinamidase/pyrazinamidase [Larsenimonas salina]|uniref:bifunctional nicotinamidase/pyrazinamidase n=1 Tax=Larsenimonas salina TaxID=1295565 RepID=UPI0020740652|nr:bifunctional nicotinamidase/pyrazinamidase [Larsenimonas salina]MCM5704343.1 bifunctional nicotinamidase/pyrazinamidase [Larsenimonas salina]
MIKRSALIVVDVQPDFMPGGPLACHEGDTIVPGINRLLEARRFERVVATQDWHPAGHASFASQHSGAAPFDTASLHGVPHTLWPDHCVQGSRGAALAPALETDRIDLILRKGTHPAIDSYSAFQNNIGPEGTRTPTGLAGWLLDTGITHVYLCGLARDVCVLWSAEDSQNLGFETHVLWSLTRPVTPETDGATRTRLEALGITLIEEDPTHARSAHE